jgi:hypothetical protein
VDRLPRRLVQVLQERQRRIAELLAARHRSAEIEEQTAELVLLPEWPTAYTCLIEPPAPSPTPSRRLSAMNSPAVRETADLLARAERTGKPMPPVRDRLPAHDVSAAYAVQRLNVERKLADGRRVVGRKIGLTSPAVQAQLGVDRPDFGALLSDMAVPDGGTVPAGRLLQPKVEAEVALVLGADLDMAEPHVADSTSKAALVLVPRRSPPSSTSPSPKTGPISANTSRAPSRTAATASRG